MNKYQASRERLLIPKDINEVFTELADRSPQQLEAKDVL